MWLYTFIGGRSPSVKVRAMENSTNFANFAAIALAAVAVCLSKCKQVSIKGSISTSSLIQFDGVCNEPGPTGSHKQDGLLPELNTKNHCRLLNCATPS